MAVLISSILRLPVFFCCFILISISISISGGVVSAVDCSSLVLSMADCLSFVTEGSTTMKPDGTCCSGLKTVLKTDAECLCETFRNSAQLGVTLNITKALALPSACHVSAPSVTNCGIASPAPALSPFAVVSPSSVAGEEPTGNLGGAYEVAPAPAPVSSGSSAFTTASITLLYIAMLLSLALF